MSALTTPPEDDSTPATPLIETPLSLLPDLTLLGIEEIDAGICADTFENRKALRRNKYSWIQVFDTSGDLTELIQGISPEMVEARSLTVLEDKRIILTDPRDLNSDYASGLNLLVEPEAVNLVPAWVIAANRHWIQLAKQRRETGKNIRPSLTGPPGRCKYIKANGIRCQFFHGGRIGENNLCRTHMGSTHTRPINTAERARAKLRAASVAAVESLEELMESSLSEPVKLKAATEILDRAGIRGGVEIDSNVKVEVRSHKEIVVERLDRLREGAEIQRLKQLEALNTEDAEIVTDAEDEDTENGH